MAARVRAHAPRAAAGTAHGAGLRLCCNRRASLRLCAQACAALARAELLRRTAPTAPMYHPAMPGPPAWGCFTAPPCQAEVAAEALLGMLFTNIFWVGLWDLLDNTIFPNDTNSQMCFLARACLAARHGPG